MSLSLRERILTVYRGATPDVVPFMLDLSHWHLHRTGAPWDLTAAYERPQTDLIAYHRRHRIGFYIANLATQYETRYGDGIESEVEKHGRDGSPEIVWRLRTPVGTIERRRVWEPGSYSWAVSRWGIQDEEGMRVLARALESRSYRPRWDLYRAWREEAGDLGVVCGLTGYSAMGQLLNAWMGVERTILAANDWPDTMREVVDRINANNLLLVDLFAASPVEVVLMGDNFSSDIQPPDFFVRWSAPYYREAIRRLHAAGKFVAVHVDGRLRGALAMMREVGADCCDAVTPAAVPGGDLVARECRREAGPHLILSGGVAPALWHPESSLDAFRGAVRDWLGLRRESPRLIAAAGDQVPPGAEERRIFLMRDMVEELGAY